MNRIAIQAICTTAVLLFVYGVASIALSDDQGESADAGDKLRYMHVEVPEDQPELWPRFGYDFSLPIRTEKFRAMLQAVQSGRQQQLTSPNSPRLKQLSLTGKLVADAFIGSGRFDIDYGGSAPAFVSMNGCRIAIRNARWDDDTPASMGTNSDGELVMTVEKPGTVEFDWSCSVVRDTTGVIRTNLQLPSGLSASISLDAPNRYVFSSTDGIVSKRNKDADDTSEYVIEMGGRTSTRITLVPVSITNAPSGMAIVGQNSRYDISSTGFSLMTQFNIQLFQRPYTTPTVEFDSDSGVNIIGVQIEGEEAEWSMVENGRISVTLPQPLPAGSTSRIQIFGVGRLQTGLLAPLPSIRPTRLVWQASDVSIVVDKDLIIRGVRAADSSPLSFSNVSSDASGSQMNIRLADKDTRILLNVAERSQQVTAERVFAWNIGAGEVEGRLSLILHANAGDIFTANLEVAPHWNFSEEDVKVYSDSEDGRTVVPHHLVNAGRTASAEAPVVRLILDSPLQQGQSMYIQIRAEYDRPLPTPSFPLQSLLFADVKGAATSTKTVIVSAQSPIQATVAGEADVKYGDASAISPDHDVSFLKTGSSGIVVVSDDEFRGAIVRLRRGAPRVTVNIRSRIEVRSETVTHQHQMECTPDASGIKKLRLVFLPAGTNSPRWSLPPGIAPETVTFRRLANDAENEPDPETPGIWEITFAAAQTAPFTLGVERVAPWSMETPHSISLLSIADAFSQQARVVVLGEKLTPLSVESRNVQLLPAGMTDLWDEAELNLLGVYRYVPSPTESGSDAAIRIRLDRQQEPQTFAWQMILKSRVANNTPGAHWATWLIENGSRRHVHITMPNDCEIKSVLVNGEAKEIKRDESGRLVVTMESLKRTAEVSVGFTNPGERFVFWSDLQALLPDIDIPVLVRQWHVSPPEGFVVRELKSENKSVDIQLPFQSPMTASTSPLSRVNTSRTYRQYPPDNEIDANAWLTAFEQRLLIPGATWGAVLLSAQLQGTNESSNVPLKLLLDPAALASAGVVPASNVIDSHHAPDSLSDILKLSRLELVISSDRAILTGKAFTARYRQQLTPGPQAGVWIASSQRLEELLDDDNSLLDHYITPQVWASALFEPQSQVADDIGEEVKCIYGLGEQTRESTVVLYHDLSFRSLLVALAVGLAGLTATLRGYPLRLLLSVCFVVAGCCLAARSPWSSALWTLLIGTGLGGAIVLIRRHRSTKRQAVSATNIRSTTTVIAVAIGLGLGFASTCDCANSQETPKVYPVWIPVDDEGRPTDFVYLPQEFEKLLSERSRNLRTSRAWMIDRAKYTLTMQRQLANERLEIELLEMEFDIVVSQDTDSLSIPLRRDEFLFGEDWAHLNDALTEPVWTSDESQLRIPIEGPGRYQLRLRVRPVVAVQRNIAKFALTLPPVPNANLTAYVPADVPDVNIGLCFGEVTEEKQEDSNVRILSAELGAISSLVVDFPRQRAEQIAPPTFDTEEYAWLTIGVQSNIDFKLNGPATEEELNDVLVEIDESLEVVSENVQPVESTSSAYALFRVPIQTVDNRFEANLTLRFRSPPEAGLFSIPHIRPVGAKHRRRWLAISGAAKAISDTSSTSQLAVGKFLAGWGETEQSPDQTYVCEARHGATLLELPPTRRMRAAREKLICSFSSKRAEMEYRVHLSPTEDPSPQLSFRLPRGVNVKTAEILASEPDMPPPNLVWWGADGQDLQLFLAGDLTVAFDVRLTVSLDVVATGTTKVPLIQLIDCELESSQVELFRKTDARVEIVRQAGFAELEVDSRYIVGLGRAFTYLQAQLPAKTTKGRQCVVRIRPVDVKATGTQITSLERHDADWKTEVDFHVEVRSGVVDRLQFELPSQHIDTLQLTPAAPYRLSETIDSSRTLLTIEPLKAIDGEYNIKLTLDLASSAGEEVTLPNIRPICDFATQRFVLLPTTIDSRNVYWDREGLENASIPPTQLDSLTRTENTQFYEVTADPHRAKLRMITDLTGVPLVRLADVHFAWDGAGQAVGRAMLDIAPAGMTTCVLQLPEEMRLCQVLIDDSLCETTAAGVGRWRIKLASTILPQRIDVLYSGPTRDGVSHAYAPVIVDVAVERTLWTFYSPLADAFTPDSESLTPIQQDLMRLRSMSNTIRLPRHIRLEFSSDEIRDWLGTWQRRWQSRRRQLTTNQLVLAEISNRIPTDNPLQAIDMSYQQSIDELDLPELENPNLDVMANYVGSEHDARWQYLVASSPVVSRRMVKGASRLMPVERNGGLLSGVSWSRTVAIGLLFVMAAVVILSPKLLSRTDWHLRCGAAVVTAILLAGSMLAGSVFLWALLAAFAAMAIVWMRNSAIADPILSAIVVRARNQRDV